MHQSIVDILNICNIRNVKLFLQNNSTCIDVMIKEECGHAGRGFSIDDGPVDGCCSTILGQQCCMDIERAEAGHCPYHLWQHTESDDNLEIGFIRA